MKEIVFALLMVMVWFSPLFSQTLGQDDQSEAAEQNDPTDGKAPPSLRVFPFQWVDLTEPSKEAKSFACESIFLDGQLDEGVDVVQMDMSFEYFGEKYNSATISVNGFVTLGVNANDRNTISSLTGLNSYPTEIPSQQLPNNIIAPFWMDLVLDGVDGFIYYRTIKPESKDKNFDHLIIQWEKSNIFHQPNQIATFQLILFSGGGIMFQYKTIEMDDVRERYDPNFMPPDPYAYSDFDLMRYIADENQVGEHFNIGYEDSTGTKGTEWKSTVTPGSGLGNELVPEWASGSGDNFLDFIDGRDRRNNAVTGSNGGGCFIGKKKSKLDR